LQHVLHPMGMFEMLSRAKSIGYVLFSALALCGHAYAQADSESLDYTYEGEFDVVENDQVTLGNAGVTSIVDGPRRPFFSGAGDPEVIRQKVAQWGDPLTPPHIRVRCVKEASGKIFGKRWRTCVGWATDTKTLQRELFLIVKGPNPDSLADEVKAKIRTALEECLASAVGFGAKAAYATPSPEPMARIAAGFGAGKIAFDQCIAIQKVALSAYFASLPGDYSLDFDATSGWSKWSNE
jgi:hypothetical protein